jgi:DNA adenine methylase
MMNIVTPLRYPGGKTKLYSYVSNLININGMSGCTYVEPFAGGAGLALKLLINGIVKDVVLNDIDYAIYSIWDLILNHTDVLCNFISNVPLNVIEWQKQKAVYNNRNEYSKIEVGLSAFYLNRTNVSGVLTGGVIGGLSQNGNYKIDARFNREELIKRIITISKYKELIHLYNWNASEFVLNILPNYNNCFVYFDPPYVKKGPNLYRNSFTLEDHKNLSEVITACRFKWIVTYDKCNFIKDLYKGFEYETLSINYSAGQTKVGDEIIIFNHNIIHNIKKEKSNRDKKPQLGQLG